MFALYSRRLITQRTSLCIAKYLHHFIAAPSTSASTAMCVLALVITRYRTDKFSRSFLPVAVHLWNLLLLDVCSGTTLSSLRVLRTCVYRVLSLIFILFFLLSFCCSIACLVSRLRAIMVYKGCLFS